MKRFFGIVAALVLCSQVLGGDDAAKDLKLMQGTWTGAVLEADGKEPSDDEKKVSFKLVVKDDKYQIYIGDTAKPVTEGKLKLDAGKKPKTIDAMPAEAKDKVQRGLYEITGDEIRVAFGPLDAERPTAFKTKADSKQVLIQYKRAKGK